MGERWFERSFAFDVTLSRFPCILERLRGTPARVEEKVRGVAPARLTKRIGNTWSIQENIAHLTDLETLHDARLGDYLAGVDVLRAADLENKGTWAAGHNARAIGEVLAEFRRVRREFVKRLEEWDPARLEMSAMHPRLKVPMRVIDLAEFVAEHDDYHLARVEELMRQV